jgi:hypothetical protein
MQLSEPALTRLPQSIQEVEALVSLLYQPGVAPHDLVAIQNRLHELQLSDLGWKIGDGLLASADSNVRFFGALTFTIKLHSLGFVSNPPPSSVTKLAALQPFSSFEMHPVRLRRDFRSWNEISFALPFSRLFCWSAANFVTREPPWPCS